jgi:hypothetical protein
MFDLRTISATIALWLLALLWLAVIWSQQGPDTSAAGNVPETCVVAASSSGLMPPPPGASGGSC